MATPEPRQSIDINALIQQAQQARAQAAQDKLRAESQAAAKSALDKKSKSIKAQADSKFRYAEGLERSLNNFEDKLKFYALKISRGDVLDPVEQKDFDRAVEQYNKVSVTYNTTVSEGNAILSKLPEQPSGPTGPTGPTTTATATATGSTGTAQEQVSLEDFLKNLNDNPKAVNQVKSYLGITKLDGILDYETISKIYTKEKEIETLAGIRGPIDRLSYYAQTKGTGTGVTATTTISPVATATTYINAAFKEVGINRDATPQEITALTKVLNDAESRFKTTVKGGVTKDLLGNRTQFIANLITTGKYVDPNTGKAIKGVKEDIKKAASVLGTLSKSAQAVKADTRSLNVQTLQSTANANGVILSPEQLNQYALDIQNGKDIKVIQSQIRNLAGIGMPDSVKKLLAEGTDLDTIYSPYKQTMAAVLELNPTTIGFSDPVLRSAIGPNGEVPLYDFQRALRKDARWQYTNNAKEDVFQSVSKVFQDFGLQG